MSEAVTTEQAARALADAQALVAQATEAEQERVRAGLIQRLAAVRQEHRDAVEFYNQMSAQIRAEREARANVQEKINQQLRRITECWAEQPAVADFLPNDPEVIRWRKAWRALERKRDELIEQRDAMPDPDVTLRESGAAFYEGPYGKIATLEFSERNLLRQLDPVKSSTRVEGTITGVR